MVSGFDPNRPTVARVYDHLLGGKDNFAADREFGVLLEEVLPAARTAVAANRDFLRRAVLHLAQAGIDQFLDLGSGLPTRQNVHQIAHAVNPEARVVYVDNDLIVVRHGQAMLAHDGLVAMVEGDLRDHEAILGHPEVTALLDFSRPVGVLMTAVLQFVPDAGEAAGIVRAVREATSPGSHLVLSHECGDRLSTRQRTRLHALYGLTSSPIMLRTRDEIAALCDGLEFITPGMVCVAAWRPDPPHLLSMDAPYRRSPDSGTHVLAGVARLHAAADSAEPAVAESASGERDRPLVLRSSMACTG